MAGSWHYRLCARTSDARFCGMRQRDSSAARAIHRPLTVREWCSACRLRGLFCWQEYLYRVPQDRGRPLDRILYNLGLLDNTLGNTSAAEGYLIKAFEKEPENYDYLYALATFYLEHGEKAKAMIYARQLAQKFPDNPAGRQLVDAAGK